MAPPALALKLFSLTVKTVSKPVAKLIERYVMAHPALR